MRALAEVLILSLACGPLGVWVLLYRDAYAAESISHGMLPGLVVAALAGVPLLLGAIGGVLRRRGGDRARRARPAARAPTSASRSCVSALFGLGGMLALSPESPPRLQELLFGDLLGVTGGDLVVAGAARRRRRARARRRATARSRSSASTAARPPRSARGPARWELALLVVLAVTTVAAVQGLGNLLLVALVLAPAAAALSLARRLAAVLALSVALAALVRRRRACCSPTTSRSPRAPRSRCARSRSPALALLAAARWPLDPLTSAYACATIAPRWARRR